MFLDKLLNKIPYFRRRQAAKAQQAVVDMKRDLVAIKERFNEGFFEPSNIRRLHNIVNSPLVSLTEDVIYGTMKEISLRTKSSATAVKLVESKVFKKSDLERSPFISMSRNRVYFNDWYSNKETLTRFIDLLKPYLAVEVWLQDNPEIELLEELDFSEFGDIDIGMYDTLVWRLLLEDLVSIISFYLEIQYE
jgi:hypothetical protein